MKGFPDLPPIWLVGFCGLAWGLARLVPVGYVIGSLGQGFGAVLILSALGLIVWSALWFRRKNTTIEPHHTPKSLIVEGPYRLSRNPIYLAMLAILTGWVLYLGALTPLVLPFVFARVLTSRFIIPEEAVLREAFGPEAERYIDATRRWL